MCSSDLAVLALIAEHRRKAEALLGAFEAIEEHLLDQGGRLPPYLTLTYGMTYARAVVDWCDGAAKHVEKGMPVPARKGGAR